MSRPQGGRGGNNNGTHHRLILLLRFIVALQIPFVRGFATVHNHRSSVSTPPLVAFAPTRTSRSSSKLNHQGRPPAHHHQQQQPSLLSLQMSSSNNPLSSIIGDMASSLFGGSPGSSLTESSCSNVDKALKAPSSPSNNNDNNDWSSIRDLLQKQQTPEERIFRDNLTKGYGIGSPLHKIRLFHDGNKEEDIQVTFFRDHASWCPYCQKVWLTLEEKQIPYRIEKINMRCYGEKPQSFQQLQPSGAIPVAIINGVTYRQSNDIIFALDSDPIFSQYKSMTCWGNDMDPNSTTDPIRDKARSYLKLERQLFSMWMNWLTRSDNSTGRAKQSFLETLQMVEDALQSSSGPFFMGNNITQVDVLYAPFLERMVASLLYYKGFQIRVVPGSTTTASTDYPAVNQWFDAMEKLPSYQVTKSDYYTHCWDLPPQLGGCTSEPAGKVYEAAINGEQDSWKLPLSPHNDGIEPDWDWTGDESAAKREAVERLSANHKSIVKFAARGAGTKGLPTYWAPLSDPLATSNEAIQPGVDSVLRIVCLAMLQGIEEQQTIMTQTATIISEKGGKEYVTALVASLSYLRDRVGVPRDMKLPAARQLRAHLNWSIDIILDAAGTAK